MYPNEKNVFMVPNHKKKGDYYKNLCLPHFSMNFYYKEKGGKKSISYKTRNINIMYPNEKDKVFMVPNQKKIGDSSSSLCLSY